MNDIIDTILKQKKITDLLESRGIFPAKEYQDRWAYKCPIHAGDNDPSFMVFKNDGEQQTYHCFGCHSQIDVINLLCELDGISLKEAVRILLKDLDIEVGSSTDIMIEEALEFHKKTDSSKALERKMLEIGWLCRGHLKWCKYETDEVLFFDRVYFQIDTIARRGDLELLTKMGDYLSETGIPIRVAWIEHKKEQEIMSLVSKETGWQK